MASDIRVVAFLQARPGHEDAAREAALACVAPTRAEAGSRSYVLHRDTQDPSVFAFVEHWDSRQALDAHVQTPHFKALGRALEGKLAVPLDIRVLTPF